MRRIGPAFALLSLAAACGGSSAPARTSACPAVASSSAAAHETAPPPAPIDFAYDANVPLDVRETSRREYPHAIAREITYASPRGGRVTATVFEPRDAKPPYAGVLDLHWGQGDKSEWVVDALALAEMGAVSIAIDAPRTAEGMRASYVEHVIDARRAIDLLASRADVDRERLAVVGHSLGAHVGGILAGIDQRPRAFVLMGGVAKLTRLLEEAQTPGLREERAQAGEAAWREGVARMEPLDAVHWVDKAPATARFLLQYAREDAIVGPSFANEYLAAIPSPKKELRWYWGPHEMNDPRALADRVRWLGAALLLAAAPADLAEPVVVPDFVQAATAASDRSAEDRALDGPRRSAELLAFAGVREGMRAGEVGAWQGYTADLLSRAVGASGHVWAEDPKDYEKWIVKAWEARSARADFAARVTHLVRPFEDPFGADVRDLDAVFSVMFYHDTVWLKTDRAKMNAAVFAALARGGEYVVVDHSARPGEGLSVCKTLHRIEERALVDEIRQAGFVLAGHADFLRHPEDARDWNAGDEGPRDKRGTSDRFVLRFVKP